MMTLRPRCAFHGAAKRTQLRICLVALQLGLLAVVQSLCQASLGFISAANRHDLPARGTWGRLCGRQLLQHGRFTQRHSRGGEAVDFQVGDRVKATSPDDEQNYPATIKKVNNDGTFTVKWDDPDGGPETDDVDVGAMKKIIVFKDYVVGDDVPYPGVVSKINEDGTFQVKWDDPDGGPETDIVNAEKMKKVVVFKNYKVDDVVEAVFPDDGQMYPGTVIKINGDDTFQVRWDDSDGGPEDSPVKAKDMKYPPIPLDKLEVGQKFTGTVKTVREFGAFVDIGAETEGLVHISRISNERVNDPNDYVEVDQEVDVWVSDIRDDGKFGLTMVEGRTGGGRRPVDLTLFEVLDADEWLTGTVEGVMTFGAFVSVTLPDGSASASGLVHVSQIKDGFVEDVSAEVQVGQQVQVRIVNVDMERSKMSLSMRSNGGASPAARPPADLSVFDGIPSDQWLDGKVARTAPFGAFVTVTAPDSDATADGLVHITA
eukprot:CAMPEP_0172783138 /NCGR_PEP_ID=MMETSP1074-20121228/204285_1 /TAXON_ID=2916 /ORGANISM="Ceratium fusus, Strain PA161109" /LENGTH=485 /DNA_ID=CAMNT_0013620125 /DNA_START=1 /DNA_END=1455 /DNA_ORIENTATION=-